MAAHRIKFKQLVGSLAVIEGTVRIDGDELEFELAMTESVSGPVGAVITRRVPMMDLESVEVTRRLLRRSRLEFTAKGVKTFQSMPGSKGFKYTVLASDPHRNVVSFVRDVLFDTAQIEMDLLSKRLERGSEG
ncbi:hypothetical protein N9Z02_01740 [Akkermansiaceae bacterium]|nr:hypothetical protein [Akkermansiaceae bacterium]